SSSTKFLMVPPSHVQKNPYRVFQYASSPVVILMFLTEKPFPLNVSVKGLSGVPIPCHSSIYDRSISARRLISPLYFHSARLSPAFTASRKRHRSSSVLIPRSIFSSGFLRSCVTVTVAVS